MWHASSLSPPGQRTCITTSSVGWHNRLGRCATAVPTPHFRESGMFASTLSVRVTFRQMEIRRISGLGLFLFSLVSILHTVGGGQLAAAAAAAACNRDAVSACHLGIGLCAGAEAATGHGT